MVNANAIRFVVGIIGNVISTFLFLSPIPTFIKICKKKDVESFDPKIYIVTVLNCLFWCYYGMPFVNPNSILVVTINGAGLVIELIYIGIFFFYAPKNGRVKVILLLVGEIVLFAVILVITMLTISEHKMAMNRPYRAVVIGIICDVFNVIMYSSPLFIVRDVIRTKSVKYMPFHILLANFMNGCCWTAYALIGKIDYFILISNGLGAFFGLVQLIVYGKYRKTTPKDDDHSNKATNEVQLSNV
ncbi:PREDICTED: bidirectional sugar transporter SWEET6b-like [Fragaria vesca subsp. vesca]